MAQLWREIQSNDCALDPEFPGIKYISYLSSHFSFLTEAKMTKKKNPPAVELALTPTTHMHTHTSSFAPHVTSRLHWKKIQ